MGNTPKHLALDQGMFDLRDIAIGPMEAALLRSNKFNIPKYKEAKRVSQAVKYIDRRKLYYS